MDNEAKNQEVLSILIPVYNEQAYLARIIRRVIAAPVPKKLRKEIILVNDASTDRTAEVMVSLEAEYPGLIRTFHQSPNQGKGAAIRRAIQEMTGDYAIIQDADLEYDPNEYPIVLAPLVEGYADVVYGSRFATRTMRKVLFYHHKLGNLFLTHLSNFMTGLDLTDMETCYKAFRGEILKSIPLRSNRFGIEPEITAKVAKRGLSVYEVPISYHGRRYSEGKKIGWKDGFSAISTILKYWLIDDCWNAEHIRATRLLRTMEYSRNFTRQAVKRIVPELGTKIFDAEAQFGNISRLLPQRERLTLSDSDEHYRQMLENLYDGNAVVDVVPFDPADESSAVPNADYDTVLFYNQLQKYENPAAVLRNLGRLLPAGGRLILLLPARPSLWGAVDEANGNRVRYTQKQIGQELTQAGFKMIKSESFNKSGVWLTRWNNSRSRTEPGHWGMKFYDFTLPLFEKIACLLPIFGANMMVVAEKTEQK